MGLLLAQDVPFDSSQMWIFFALAMMALVYVSVLRPMMRKRKDPLEKPSGFTSLSQQRAVERQMQSLLVELSEMSRQITAQLDTRSAKLELLIKEADEKIAALHRAGNGSMQGSAVSAVTPASDPVEMPVVPAPLELDPRHVQVYALADEGQDASAIASALGRPRGEVELILALRGQKL